MFLRPLKKNRDLYYECIDLWCEPDALRIQSALLRGALRVAREKGALGVRFPIVSPEIGCLVRTYRGATIGKYPNIEKIKFPPINGIVSSSDANTFGYFTRMTGEYGL